MEKHQEIDAAAASPARAKPMHTSEFFNDPPRLKKGVIPNYVFDSIGKPSLLDTEVVAEYDALFFRLVETIDPDIAVEWMWVADLAHIVWEIRRVRGVRNGIVERETASALGEVVWDILSGDYDREKMVDIRDRLVSHWNSGDAFRRQIVRRFLTRRGVDFHQVHAVVYCKHLDKISKLEGLIANLGRRRDTVYREIGRRRGAVARRVRDMLNSEFDLETGEPVCWHPTNR